MSKHEKHGPLSGPKTLDELVDEARGIEADRVGILHQVAVVEYRELPVDDFAVTDPDRADARSPDADRPADRRRASSRRLHELTNRPESSIDCTSVLDAN